MRKTHKGYELVTNDDAQPEETVVEIPPEEPQEEENVRNLVSEPEPKPVGLLEAQTLARARRKAEGLTLNNPSPPSALQKLTGACGWPPLLFRPLLVPPLPPPLLLLLLLPLTSSLVEQ